MEIGNRQKLCLPVRRAKPPALVPGTSGNGGCGTSCRRCGSRRRPSQRLDMTTERGGPADLDRAHDAPLDASETPGIVASIGVAVAAENLRGLEKVGSERRACPRRAHIRRRDLHRQPVEGALRASRSNESRPACSAPSSTGSRGPAGPG